MNPDPGQSTTSPKDETGQKPKPNTPSSIDIDDIKLSQDYPAMIGVKKELLTLPVRRPGKEWWFRTHPDDTYWVQTRVIELKDPDETYLVANSLWDQLAAESTLVLKVLILTVNHKQDPFWWSIRLPDDDGKLDPWNESALEAAQKGKGQWIRICSNRTMKRYDVRTSSVMVKVPQFPNKPPLSNTEGRVLELITDRPEGILGKEILDKLQDISLEQSTLTRHIILNLKAWHGVANRSGVGYYVESTPPPSKSD